MHHLTMDAVVSIFSARTFIARQVLFAVYARYAAAVIQKPLLYRKQYTKNTTHWPGIVHQPDYQHHIQATEVPVANRHSNSKNKKSKRSVLAQWNCTQVEMLKVKEKDLLKYDSCGLSTGTLTRNCRAQVTCLEEMARSYCVSVVNGFVCLEVGKQVSVAIRTRQNVVYGIRRTLHARVVPCLTICLRLLRILIELTGITDASSHRWHVGCVNVLLL